MLKLKRKLLKLMGYANAAPAARQPVLLENLRLAMLAALGQDGCERYTKLARQLRFSDDVQSLWYSRSELMAALAALHGETRARQEIDNLSARFRQLLPKSMTSASGGVPR